MYSPYLLFILLGIILLLIIYTFSQHSKNIKLVSTAAEDARKSVVDQGSNVIKYGKKVMKRVKNLADNKGGNLRYKLKQLSLLMDSEKSHSEFSRQIKPIPSSIFEENTNRRSTGAVPAHVYDVLRCMSLFDCFDESLFLLLCRSMKVLYFTSDNYIFQTGDPSDNIFLVQNGLIHLNILDEEDHTYFLKEAKSGDIVCSLLNVIDLLTGTEIPVYKGISAIAVTDCQILTLPIESFNSFFGECPQSRVSSLQSIFERFHNSAFFALQNYFGIAHELFSSIVSPSPNLRCHDLNDSTPCTPGSLPADDISEIDSLPSHRFSSIGKHSLLSVAIDDLSLLLDVKDRSCLEKIVKLKTYVPGTVIQQQGDVNVDLVLLLQGRIEAFSDVSTNSFNTFRQIPIFTMTRGNLVGHLSLLARCASHFTLKVRTGCSVAVISKQNFRRLTENVPGAILSIARHVISSFSPFMRLIDYGLSWTQYEAATALYRQEDDADKIYIVLHGRLRSVMTLPDGKKCLEGEYGHGELAGIVEVVTHVKRVTTLISIRDSAVVEIPTGLLDYIKWKYPDKALKLISLLGDKVLGGYKNFYSLPQNSSSQVTDGLLTLLNNIHTVAVVPMTPKVPIDSFVLELCHAMKSINTTLPLTSASVLRKFSKNAFDSSNAYQLSNWLSKLEDSYRMIVYQCDYTLTAWTQLCVTQSDCVLIVGRASDPHFISAIELEIESMHLRAQKQLVLLHPEDKTRPNGTSLWLNARSWCTLHHHIRCSKRFFYNMKREDYEKYLEVPVNRLSDFSRLARFLTGSTVGLVLGGGGARGISQIGVIRAMLETKIPIDMIGGTSIGALIGGLWAMDTNIDELGELAGRFSKDMSSLWNKIADLTFPYSAFFNGKRFNILIIALFGNLLIEDLWIPFFCVTSDITSLKMRVHNSGSLWRYVRASMTLSGYLPPLCDPLDSHLLLDGGYVNLLPVDVMRSFGAQTVFAVDVSSRVDTDFHKYGEHLSGWWILWSKFNPFARSASIPSMHEIQSRLTFMSSSDRMDSIKNANYMHYISPPVQKFATLQFNAFREISDIGYHHGTAFFSGLQMRTSLNWDILKRSATSKPVDHVVKSSTFAELANSSAFISPRTVPNVKSSEDDNVTSLGFLGSDDESENTSCRSITLEPVLKRKSLSD